MISNLNNTKGHSARLIQVSSTQSIILPTQNTLEIIENPSFMVTPGLKKYCYGLMHWQNNWIPLLNLDGLFNNSIFNKVNINGFVTVLRYKSIVKDHSVRFGAIYTPIIPTTVTIYDDDFCELPENLHSYKAYSLSCVKTQDQSIPILSVTRLFE